MPAPHPRMHGLTHARGGPDPIPAIDVDAIQFDTSPQEGGFLEVTTTTGGLDIVQSSPSDDLFLYAETTSVTITGENGVIISANGNNGIVLDADGAGDILLDVSSGSASVQIWLGAGNYLVLDGLPTSNPGGSGRVWNDGGTLKIT